MKDDEKTYIRSDMISGETLIDEKKAAGMLTTKALSPLRHSAGGNPAYDIAWAKTGSPHGGKAAACFRSRVTRCPCYIQIPFHIDPY